MIRFVLFFGALAMSGCYSHHTGGGVRDDDGGTGTSCGPDTCEEDEICCERCDGEAFCTFDRCPPDDCPSDCGGSSLDCDPGEYCVSEVGVCGGGTCAPLPTGCFGDCPLVCGCDGETYCNVCEAARAATSVLHFGECESTPPCACGPGGFCDFGTACFDNPFPVCTPFPTACPGIEAPVCSCDGITYPNGCFAAAEGASVRSAGACGSDTVRATCEQLCQFGENFCGSVVENCPEICADSLAVCSEDELALARSCLMTPDCMVASACLQDVPCIPITMM